MHADLINIGLAFLEGFGLIISPCILPILPIILTGSLTSGKARPVGIIIGFVLTFCVVTLFSRALIETLHITPSTLRNIAYTMLILFGLVMISSYLTEKFNLLTTRLTGFGSSLQLANNPQSGFWGGVLFGGLVGIIWTPCAGPILAIVIVQVVIQQTKFSSILAVIAFAIGAGVPMLVIAFLGRNIMNQFKVFRDKASFFRKLLGYLIILSVIFAIYGVNLTLSYSNQTKPQYTSLTLTNSLEKPYPAPAIDGIDAWINSPPLTLADLKGKVVLIDFWTYSCINCIRTLPYLKDWYAKYHDKGFEIIGVHTPEFEFEHDLANVKKAVADFGIRYPVALDNHFVTWKNFNNEYWPAHYLIDKKGNVVYQHFGEGEYDVTENNIRYLLGESNAVAQTGGGENYTANETPETYLGYARAENYAGTESVVRDSAAVYSYPAVLAQNQWALKGKWTIDADKIVSGSDGAAIKLNFYAKHVYIVMGKAGKSIKVKLLLNGAELSADKGKDVTNSQMLVSNNRLYSIVELPAASAGIVEVIAMSSGLEVYTFTFGS